MHNSKRQIAFSAVMAMLLYLLPNMAQDIHRVLGHHEIHTETISPKSLHFLTHFEKCAVCAFEFNIVDENPCLLYVPMIQTENLIYSVKPENQLQNNAFHYYNLRAPPQA